MAQEKKDEGRILDLSHIGRRPDRMVVRLADGDHEMLGRDDLDPVLIARVNVEMEQYNDETGGPIEQAQRQQAALQKVARFAIPTLPEGLELSIPFLDLVEIMQAFLEPLMGLTEDPRMARMVELARSRLGTTHIVPDLAHHYPASDPLMWPRMPVRILEQFANRMSVHDARLALNVFRGVNIAMGDPKSHSTKRALRELQREAKALGRRRSARVHRPATEEERRAAMGSFGGQLDG